MVIGVEPNLTFNQKEKSVLPHNTTKMAQLVEKDTFEEKHEFDGIVTQAPFQRQRSRQEPKIRRSQNSLISTILYSGVHDSRQ